MSTHLDERWFRAFCSGDTKAWQDFIRSQLGQQIARRARATVAAIRDFKYLRQESFDDVLQECFTNIYEASLKHLESGEPVPLPGFFYRVAERACLAVQRRARGCADGLYQANAVRDDAGEKRPAIEAHDIDPNAMGEYGQTELSDLINRAGIRPEEKQVVLLWLDGYSLPGIARQLEVPAATVRSRFLAALPKLRKALGE